MDIALVSYVPDNAVFRAVEAFMQSYGKLDNTEV